MQALTLASYSDGGGVEDFEIYSYRPSEDKIEGAPQREVVNTSRRSFELIA